MKTLPLSHQQRNALAQVNKRISPLLVCSFIAMTCGVGVLVATYIRGPIVVLEAVPQLVTADGHTRLGPIALISGDLAITPGIPAPGSQILMANEQTVPFTVVASRPINQGSTFSLLRINAAAGGGSASLGPVTSGAKVACDAAEGHWDGSLVQNAETGWFDPQPASGLSEGCGVRTETTVVGVAVKRSGVISVAGAHVLMSTFPEIQGAH